jgi:predicted PurR-regulated permease PerM
VSNGRLVYLTENDIVLLGSPVWMPLAWACVIVELGYPAVRLFGVFKARRGTRRAAVTASLLIASAAAITVGFYE